MGEIGKRLLPATIDRIANNDPDRVWASMPRLGTLDYYDIPFSTLANAINRAAWWIVENVGRPTLDSFPTIAYLGPSDLRYYVMLIAIVKAGYKPLFLSHRNSVAANKALFSSTKCSIFLHAFQDLVSVTSVDHASIRTVQAPSVEELWNPEQAKPFPSEKSFEDALNDPFVIMHTSGSSGFPKPVTYTHNVMAAADLRQTVKSPPGTLTDIEYRSKASNREILGYPPFHAAGLLVGLQDSVWYNMIIVFPPTDRILDGALFRDILARARAHGAYVLPNVVEQISRMPDALAKIDEVLDYLVWAGGPISEAAGNALTRVTRLLQSYASTEIGSTNTLTCKPHEDWNYHWFTPGANGFDFRPVPGTGGLHELFVVRDSANAYTPPVFRAFPDLTEWPMNDLFSQHPNNAALWRHEGRSDDLIVLGNGGNLNPRPLEAAIRSHASVRDAMVIGARRPRPAVLIEPTVPIDSADHAAMRAFIDSIMPTIQASNGVAPVNGQLERELVLLTDPDRPFPRTGKMTVQRGAAMQLYSADFDRAYNALPEHLKKARVERIGIS